MSLRVSWALAISISLHAALAIGAFYYYLHHRSATPAPELLVEAPLGAVFVKEDPEEAQIKPVPLDDTQSPTSFPSEVKPAAQESTFGSPQAQPGVPDGEAHPVGSIQPEYPAMSRKLGEEGEAIFVVDIRADGSVEAVRLDHSSGHDRLDEAAKETLLAATFRAAMKKGQPEASSKKFRIEFKLNSP